MRSTVLVKAFRILEILCEQPGDCSLAGLTSATGLAKPTVHRIVSDLMELGYVGHASGGAYYLTGKLRRLTLPMDCRSLAVAAEPVLRKLHEQTAETVNLAVCRRERVVYLRVLESAHSLRRVVVPQESDPLHCTALGRVILCHMDPAIREHLLRSRPLERCTPETVTDPDELERILQQVRKDGFSVEKSQSEMGVMCVAAPVCNDNGLVAAISVSAPTARVDAKKEETLIEQVCAKSAGLSRELKKKGANTS